MAGDILLDTNIVIAAWANDAIVLEKLRTYENVVVSVTVLGELYYGARGSANADKNISRIEQHVKSWTVLDCDLDIARNYGEIKQELRRKATPIPDNDIWIAAVARQHALPLATRDAHFKAVDGLSLQIW
ncbi:MAG TPA: type II toxin-antitoxin system VapC family toxin [Planctomycetota bacterium]|jgi:tRNA(fMet)-specific endonuclease VapC